MDEGYFPKLLQRLCAEIGAEVTFEPAFRRAGYITFANGARRFFKGTNLDLNGSAAAQIAQDKDFCAKFLERAGLNVPEGQVVFAPKCVAKWRAKNPGVAARMDPYGDAEAAAERWGFPLFVKPNEGAEGEGVRQVADEAQLRAHLEVLYQQYDRVLIQRPAAGDDYRIVVLDGEVVLAYQRVPLTVTGTGGATIGALLQERAEALAASGRQAIAEADDPRVLAHLATQGLSLADCPAPGEQVRLLANANLSTGGEVVDVSDQIDQTHQQMALEAAKAVGLRFAGVDILARQIEEPDPEATVLEVNAAPGLNNYAATGARAEERVTGLYRTMLAMLEREAGADQSRSMMAAKDL
ncbi:MAG: ATP-dependent carboxylate-amine ligase [Pseudomonadota bacterium]